MFPAEYIWFDEAFKKGFIKLSLKPCSSREACLDKSPLVFFLVPNPRLGQNWTRIKAQASLAM